MARTAPYANMSSTPPPPPGFASCYERTGVRHLNVKNVFLLTFKQDPFVLNNNTEVEAGLIHLPPLLEQTEITELAS